MWKVRKVFWHEFQDVTVANTKRKTAYTIVNKFREIGLLLDTKEQNQNTLHTLKRNWIKSMLCFSIPFAHPFAVLHRRLRLKVSGFTTEVRSVSKRDLKYMNVNILQGCKKYATTETIYSIYYDLSGFCFWFIDLWACWLQCESEHTW
jgi:hypothetical protein